MLPMLTGSNVKTESSSAYKKVKFTHKKDDDDDENMLPALKEEKSKSSPHKKTKSTHRKSDDNEEKENFPSKQPKTSRKERYEEDSYDEEYDTEDDSFIDDSEDLNVLKRKSAKQAKRSDSSSESEDGDEEDEDEQDLQSQVNLEKNKPFEYSVDHIGEDARLKEELSKNQVPTNSENLIVELQEKYGPKVDPKVEVETDPKKKKKDQVPPPPFNENEEEEITPAETFVPYKPKKSNIGLKHPDCIVETASLASVDPPDITYELKLPEKVYKKKKLSALQIEAVFYSCELNLFYWQ